MSNISFFLGLWGCSSETTTKTFNDNPGVTITSHDSIVDVMEGEEEVFRAQVSDTNDGLSELQIAWYRNDEIICDWSSPDPAGASQCAIIMTAESERVIAEVRDPQSAAGRAEVSLNVTPSFVPSLNLLSPSLGEVYYRDQLIRFAAEISDDEDDPEQLSAVWESSLDGQLSLNVQADSSGKIEDFGYLTEGEHAISLTVSDTSGKSASTSVVIMVGGPNNIPTCSIDTPESLSAGVIGDTVLFEALIGDDDINANQLSAQWSSDKDGDFGNVTPSSSGSVGLAYDGLSENTHTITLTVTDEVGATCTDNIFYTVGTPPTITIDQPINGDVFSTSDNILFVVRVSDNEDQPNEVMLSWVSDLDGEISTQSATSAGLAQFSASSLSAGYHNLIVHSIDTDGLTADAVVGFRINTPPEAPVIGIAPDPAQTIDNLSVSIISGGDADGDTVTYSYLWLKNGVATSMSTASISSSDTQKGDIWTIRVTPNDGHQDGVTTEASISIDNTEPVVSSVAISPSLPNNDEVLTCTASVFDPDESTTDTYVWKNESTGASLGTGSTLDLASLSIAPATEISCTYIATDSSAASSSDMAILTVQNRSPSISTVSITPSSAGTSETLDCVVQASDLDGESLIEDFSWENSTTNVILGSDSTLILDPTMSAPGDVIACIVTVFDASGDSAIQSTDVIIQNSDPFVSSVEISPSEPLNTDTLTCISIAEDADLESLTESFSWFNDTTGDSLGTSSILTLDPSTAVAGDDIRCVVTVEDPSGGSDTQEMIVTVLSTAPQFTQEAEINPNTSVMITDTLVCSGTAIDSDGSIPTLEYSWSNDTQGVVIGTTDTLSLSLAIANPTDDVTCTIAATDIDGETTTSDATITIENSVPVIDSLQLSPQTLFTDDDVTATVITSDADGETVLVAYEWSVNGVVVSTTSSTLSASNFIKGQMISVSVTPSDAQGSGIPSIDSLLVQNSPPEPPSISVDPVDAMDTDDVICSMDISSSDVDGDSITYSFEWLVDGVSSGNTSDTLTATETAVGEIWTCVVTPDDGTEEGAFGSASTNEINGDSDGDGVLDPDDLCPGYDDTLDSNSNDIPDGCESSLTFGYTGSPENFVVPEDVTLISIECTGASGWSGSYSGGKGGYTSGVLSVTEGEEFWLYVGGQGTGSSGAYNPMGGGWNGGGEGQNNGGNVSVGGGGGASDIRTEYSSDPLDSTSLLSRIIVAGGGGGATNNTGAYGGDGGGTTGQDGGQHSGYHYGRGGSQTVGGSSGGAFGYGGSSTGSMTPWNGGGGGGWYGGGVSTAHSGGGGGSSNIDGVQNGSMIQGQHSGNGQIIISYALP